MVSIATWNINSLRLRLDLVRKFVEQERPDVLCLQETKVEDGKFPLNDVRDLGFPHITYHGQKGYHGVAIFSHLPFETEERLLFAGKADARHLGVRFATGTTSLSGVTLHNFYVPAGGDIPDREQNEKFGHKLDFLRDLESTFASGRANREPMLLVGDLNIAPQIHDVWSHKELLNVVSHTPIETEWLERLRHDAGFVDVMRRFVPETEKLYTWWSYRAADWRASNRGRRLDHVWASPDLAVKATAMTVLDAARGWERPSDHVPVLVRFGD